MQEQFIKYDKFLIAGATGKTGVELVNQLLEAGKKVSIVVRNSTKAKKIFKDNYDKISSVVECELGQTQLKCQNMEDMYELYPELAKAVNDADCVISAIGAVLGEDPRVTDYLSTVELVNVCEKSKDNFRGKIFVLITSTHVTRPFSFVGLLLNSVLSYVLGWKALAENRIRQSSLNYLIVRPGRLTEKLNNAVIHVNQRDRQGGEITRRNLARTIIKSLYDGNVNKGHVTIDLIETKANENEIKYCNIREDDETDFIVADHFRTTRNFGVVVYSLIIFIFIVVIYKYKS